MPLPSPRKKEKQTDFVSRCVSFLSDKKEGQDINQRVAICNSQWRKSKKSKANLNCNEIEALDKLITNNKKRVE